MAKAAALNEIRPVLNAADAVLDKVDNAIDTVENVADKGIDIVEDTLETGIHATAQGGHFIVRSLRSPKTAVLVVLIATGAGAGYIGWKLSAKKHQRQFEEELAAQNEATRTFYERRFKVGAFESPEKAAEALGIDVETEGPVVPLSERQAAEALRSYKGRTDYTKPGQTKDESEKEPKVFVDNTPLDPEAFDFDVELGKRSADRPYIITAAEFAEGKDGHQTISFTYFDGDSTLTDEQDSPVDDPNAIVGEDNLMRFGFGSDDPNTLYVRNEVAKLDFEITRSEGSFSKEVMGFGTDTPDRRSSRGRRSGDDG